MIYKDFKGLKLSALGLGAMRLPLIAGTEQIDEAAVKEMVAYAIENGVNYFDTAYPYHGGNSETVLGKVLADYPRDSFYLATKYPGHQIASEYHPDEVFELQLKKCGVDYFDFYLLHNVNEQSIDVYTDPKWGIVDYFIEQKRLGRIKHLGFSCHCPVSVLEAFLDRYGDELEFFQIQLNYLDWTLQNADKKVELLNSRGVPVWVMEPVRGGKLASLGEEEDAELMKLCPEESIPARAFRWLQAVKGVTVVLSGMSNLEQMKDNVKTFSSERALSEAELAVIGRAVEKISHAVPCTGCRYCCDGCPKGLNIPALIKLYNEACYYASMNLDFTVTALGPEGMPSNCIGCGACAAICPQGIDIPGLMPVMDKKIREIPSWAEISRVRELEAIALREQMMKENK